MKRKTERKLFKKLRKAYNQKEYLKKNEIVAVFQRRYRNLKKIRYRLNKINYTTFSRIKLKKHIRWKIIKKYVPRLHRAFRKQKRAKSSKGSWTILRKLKRLGKKRYKVLGSTILHISLLS